MNEFTKTECLQKFCIEIQIFREFEETIHFPSVLWCYVQYKQHLHGCVRQCTFRLFKNALFPERVSNILFVFRKWCLMIFELNRHIRDLRSICPQEIYEPQPGNFVWIRIEPIIQHNMKSETTQAVYTRFCVAKWQKTKLTYLPQVWPTAILYFTHFPLPYAITKEQPSFPVERDTTKIMLTSDVSKAMWVSTWCKISYIAPKGSSWSKIRMGSPSVRSLWLDNGQVLFLFVSVHKHGKKERGQYPTILTEQAWSIKNLLYGIKHHKIIFYHPFY